MYPPRHGRLSRKCLCLPVCLILDFSFTTGSPVISSKFKTKKSLSGAKSEKYVNTSSVPSACFYDAGNCCADRKMYFSQPD